MSTAETATPTSRGQIVENRAENKKFLLQGVTILSISTRESTYQSFLPTNAVTTKGQNITFKEELLEEDIRGRRACSWTPKGAKDATRWTETVQERSQR